MYRATSLYLQYWEGSNILTCSNEALSWYRYVKAKHSQTIQNKNYLNYKFTQKASNTNQAENNWRIWVGLDTFTY